MDGHALGRLVCNDTKRRLIDHKEQKRERKRINKDKKTMCVQREKRA